MDENVNKKNGNCFYYGLLGHHINDCKHKKRVEKKMEPRIKPTQSNLLPIQM